MQTCKPLIFGCSSYWDGIQWPRQSHVKCYWVVAIGTCDRLAMTMTPYPFNSHNATWEGVLLCVLYQRALFLVNFFSFLKSSCWLKIIISWSNYSELVRTPFPPNHGCSFWCAVVQDQLLWFASPYCVTHGRLFACRFTVKTWCYKCIWCKSSVPTGVVKNPDMVKSTRWLFGLSNSHFYLFHEQLIVPVPISCLSVLKDNPCWLQNRWVMLLHCFIHCIRYPSLSFMKSDTINPASLPFGRITCMVWSFHMVGWSSLAL